MVKVIRVTFGSNSTDELEEEVTWIYNHLPPMDREIMEFIRDTRVSAAIVVNCWEAVRFVGQDALKFLATYDSLAHSALQGRYKFTSKQEFPIQPPPSEDDHLSKTLMTPFASVSREAPTIGHHYQHHPIRFLPREGSSVIPKEMSYPVTHRYNLTREAMHADDRVRIPDNR